eukprot:5364337-Amphidinium_carterae.1
MTHWPCRHPKQDRSELSRSGISSGVGSMLVAKLIRPKGFITKGNMNHFRLFCSWCQLGESCHVEMGFLALSSERWDFQRLWKGSFQPFPKVLWVLCEIAAVLETAKSIQDVAVSTIDLTIPRLKRVQGSVL